MDLPARERAVADRVRRDEHVVAVPVLNHDFASLAGAVHAQPVRVAGLPDAGEEFRHGGFVQRHVVVAGHVGHGFAGGGNHLAQRGHHIGVVGRQLPVKRVRIRVRRRGERLEPLVEEIARDHHLGDVACRGHAAQKLRDQRLVLHRFGVCIVHAQVNVADDHQFVGGCALRRLIQRLGGWGGFGAGGGRASKAAPARWIMPLS